MTDTKYTAAQPLDLDSLEALAKAATPGPWERENDDVGEDHSPFCHVGQVDEYNMRISVYQHSMPEGPRRSKIGGPKWQEKANQCLANGEYIAAANPATILALIAQARTARPKREMPPEMKAAIEEAHKTGATGALLPDGSTVFINYGHDYGDNDHLCCTACGGSGHIEDQQARTARLDTTASAQVAECLNCGKGVPEIDNCEDGRFCNIAMVPERAVAAQQAKDKSVAVLKGEVQFYKTLWQQARAREDTIAAQQAAAKAPAAQAVDLSMLPLYFKEGVENGGYYLATDVIRALTLAASPASTPEASQQAAAKAPAAQAVDATDALRKLCDQLDGMRKTRFLMPGTGQHYSYLLWEDASFYVEEARKALAASPASTPEASQQAAAKAPAAQAVTDDNGLYAAALLAVERMRGCAATYIEDHAKDTYPGQLGLRPQDVATMWAQEIHGIDAKAYLDEAIDDLAASPASTALASQQGAAVVAPNLTHVGTLSVYEDKEATFGHAYDISTNMAGHQALQSMDGYELYASPTAVAATTSEDARDAMAEHIAMIEESGWVPADGSISAEELMKIGRKWMRGREEHRGANDFLFTRTKFLKMVSEAIDTARRITQQEGESNG